MLTIEIPSREFYDETNNEFVNIKGQTLKMEHSLVSISKWESKWNKPFLGNTKIKRYELYDYFRCMTIGPTPSYVVYQSLSAKNIDKISDYMTANMTATTFSNRNENKAPSRQIITSELIYYDMISFGIPMECEKWHLNRLLTLIRICSIKNAPQQKMSRRDVMRRNSALNAQRKAKYHTRG